MDVTEVDAAYAYCERLTHHRAGNFRYGIRLLPRPDRRALCAVYAYAREIDDLADGGLDTDAKHRELSRMRQQLTNLGAHPDPVCVALGDATRRCPIPLEAFGELIDGVEMDVDGTTYSTFDDLYLYCDRVAGSVGRLCVGVFPPSSNPDAARLASTLWIGMQLTNILRDIAEDAEAGRVYLPREDLRTFVPDMSSPPISFRSGPGFDALVRFEAERALRFYTEGLRLLPYLCRRSAACLGTMAGVYLRMLIRIADEPSQLLDHRITVPAWEKLEIAVRTMAGLPRAVVRCFTVSDPPSIAAARREGASAVSDDVMLSSTAFNVGIALCGVFWTVAYVLIIRRASADGTYGMPVVALCANLSWEAISSFTQPPPGFLGPVPFVWLFIDLVIAWQALRYGPGQFPRTSARIFYGMFGLTLVMALTMTFQLNRAFMAYYNDHWGLYAGFAAALMMATLFLFMLYNRASTAGQSVPIAVCMLLGNFCAGAAWLAYPPPGIVASTFQESLVAGTLGLNALYATVLWRHGRPDGHAHAATSAPEMSHAKDEL
ncbi:phytoene/squalene synthase family protein [Streptomyces formicae]|uniref:phytoene/squalene synthase family protein n=1 Tax=Streptomyces formicae TaxID=1616117 RepID=UPI0030DC56BD